MTSHPFDPYARHYASLSVKDLLDAREASHRRFCCISNVMATAIGLYRIRKTDPDAKAYVAPKTAAAKSKKKKRSTPRTIENTVVKPWSWPCVLVFVNDWKSAHTLDRDEQIDSFIWLSDGRVVPVCVVQASSFEGLPPAATGPLTFSSNIIGGGYPLLTDLQGKERLGSLGCLVTDGDKFYGLTNQHVAGGKDREIFTLVRGERTRVGVSTENSLRKLKFTEVYPRFAGADTELNVDIGLIDIDDVTLWTAQVFGLGMLGSMVDFNSESVSLDWIGQKIVAHGGRSGRMEGEIKALFYRYSMLNGTDFVSDFLIGGRDGKLLPTAPGDSGTLWCLDPETNGAPKKVVKAKPAKKAKKKVSPAAKAKDLPERYRPVAVEWGGQKLSAEGDGLFTQYALASSVAVACRALDVEIVTDVNAEHTAYWGPVGHYKIAQLAVDWLKSKELKAFFKPNLAQLTYDASVIAKGKLANSAKSFVPLADVPDVVWKTNINRGGKAARAQENWNHYVDIDLIGKDGKTTLSALCGTPPKLDLAAWIAFYKTSPPLKNGNGRPNNMGGLPFRVWQVFDAMVEYRRKVATRDEFLCAAGILSHYLGDSCQPLHSSRHANGLEGGNTGVHGMYEEKMVDLFAAEISDRLNKFNVKSLGAALPSVKNGYEAGQAAIALMRRTQKRLPPADICNEFERLGGGTGAGVAKGLWQSFADQTIACIADGTRTLAMLWDSAYRAANGPAFSGEVAQGDLRKIYEPKTFLPSLHLANLNPKNYPIPGAKGGAQNPAKAAPAKKAPKKKAPKKRKAAKR